MSTQNINIASKNAKNANGTAILNAYNNAKITGNYSVLAASNLKTPIDDQGNTILHLIAKNLDLNTLAGIAKANPNAFSFDIVNVPNKDGDTPLHLAVVAVNQAGQQKQSEIINKLMELGANKNIPNNKGQVIAINNGITKQINAATAATTAAASSVAATAANAVTGISKQAQQSDVLNATSDQLAEWAKKLPGSDQLNAWINQLSDTDIAGNIKKLTDSFQQSVKNPGTTVGGTSCGIQTGTTSSTPVNENLDFIRNLTDKYRPQKGGYSGQRKIKSYMSDPYEFSEFGINDSFVSKKRKELIDQYSNLFSSQERPRNRFDPEAIEKYNEILQRIKDFLGVDDETAKLYRLALKINVTKDHPELKKKENDILKIEEIEKITRTKDDLQKAIKGIKIENLRQEQAERRAKFLQEQADRRTQSQSQTSERTERTERKQNNGNKDTKTKRTKAVTTTTSDADTASATSPEPTKPKRKTTKKESKVAENGYLESDEIIFSPGY